MKHRRMTAASFSALLSPSAGLRPLAVLSALAGIAASLAGALPAWGVDVPFTERVISTTIWESNSVFATDVDGDGDTDVLAASWGDDNVRWYENDGGSPPTFTEWVISTTTTTMGATSVFATDVDGDGDTDVLSATFSGGRIAWYESDGGSPPTFTERMISANDATTAFSVFATDVDGDGDTDVLSATRDDNKIAWYENNGGSPPTFTERVVSTTAGGALAVFATDMDGDGDTDVLSASYWGNKIAWYESDGSSPPTFIERVISNTADGPQSVFATDVDGDGDTDVLSASFWDDKIAWYESDGNSPPTFIERVISNTADGAQSVFATDVDGDGDTDVLSASFDDDLLWYESDGGSPPSFTERVISTSGHGAHSAFAADVDADGDTDVLCSLASDMIAWYENTTPACGNATVGPAEACDDGNVADGDGCSSMCSVESGWNCTGEPSACTTTCGDGTIAGSEECDDNNTDDSDGCSSTCTVEDGWDCTGEPSVCTEILVPAVSAWGLVAMKLLVLVAGTVVLIRRRRWSVG